ncbi:ABC transporter permease [Alloiococcus sp. CFN-8]|uniref:ABC transporter permease n=1 Tax=Alloiococcus sp. CFN-8 TaxID=3416081 RepID=UPI003CEEF3D1
MDNTSNTQVTKKTKNFGFLSSVFAIIVGLMFGFIILLVSNPAEAGQGFITILTGALTRGTRGIGQIFYYATPIIMTGLSVGFAFKTGLFNIGASGQFIMGAFFSVFVGLTMTSLGGFHWVVALIASAVGGALWALIPGLLKAYANVHEVISSIMMNYIGMYLVNAMVKNSDIIFDSLKNQSKALPKTAYIPKMGLDKIFQGSSVNGGIIIALIMAIIMYIVLTKTTFGFELRAVGFNRDASRYAGINEKKNIVLSMVIAGALAGIAGGLLYLAGSGKHIEVVDVLAAEGFTGISVALLGLSNPIGIIFSGLFIAYITAGGFYLQLFDFSTEVINIIIAVIIYFSAFSLIIKTFINKFNSRRKGGKE